MSTLGRWFFSAESFRNGMRPWLLGGLWVGGLWLGFYTTEKIEDAYEEACVGRDCPSIDWSIQLLRYSVIVNAFAVPGFIILVARDTGRRSK